MVFNLGPLEIALIAVAVIMMFGPRRIGSLAKKIGSSYFKYKGEVKDLKDSVTISARDALLGNDDPAFEKGVLTQL